MSQTSKSVVKIILMLGLICFGIGMFFIENILYYAIGITLGTGVSAARFLLLERALNRSVEMAPADAQNYTRLQYILRMTGIVIIAFIAAKVRYIDIVGFIAGLLLVQPAVYIHGLLNRNKGDGGNAETN